MLDWPVVIAKYYVLYTVQYIHYVMGADLEERATCRFQTFVRVRRSLTKQTQVFIYLFKVIILTKETNSGLR